MKKSELLNSEISYEISKMGHTDGITIGDCGLPIPSGVKRIDLALTRSIPSFLDVFKAIISELFVEEAIFAKEFEGSDLCLVLLEELSELEKLQGKKIAISYVDHEEFKGLTTDTNCIVRTGECTPYANVILRSGVVF